MVYRSMYLVYTPFPLIESESLGFKLHLNKLKAEVTEEGCELFTSVVLSQLYIGRGKLAPLHLAHGFAIELFLGLRIPLSTLIEGTCAGFIYEMVAEEGHWRQ